MKKYLATLFYFVCCSSFSLTLESVNVFGEEVSACNLSLNAADASISSAMRFNRVGLSDDSKVKAYHQIGAMEVGSTCIASLKFEIFFNSYVTLPPENTKRIFTSNVLCSKAHLMSGPKHDFGTRASNVLKQLVDLCINEIAKM